MRWGHETLSDPLLDDYDVYLWGSFPERKDTWDVDILLQHPTAKMDTEEMEAINLLSLKNSIGKNNFIVDLGFNANEDIVYFEESFDEYLKTGKKTPSAGYVYGNKWKANDIVFKNRERWQQGAVEYLDRDIIRLTSEHPYKKQIMSSHGNRLNEYYKGKPYKIKDRKRLY
jgi:hypothetical protein